MLCSERALQGPPRWLTLRLNHPSLDRAAAHRDHRLRELRPVPCQGRASRDLAYCIVWNMWSPVFGIRAFIFSVV